MGDLFSRVGTQRIGRMAMPTLLDMLGQQGIPEQRRFAQPPGFRNPFRRRY